jgi:hypothetical protein
MDLIGENSSSKKLSKALKSTSSFLVSLTCPFQLFTTQLKLIICNLGPYGFFTITTSTTIHVAILIYCSLFSEHFFKNK